MLDDAGEAHVMAAGQPKGYSMINGAKYNFYQVHWHTPSENTVDGESFPLEAHFVHQLDDSTNGGLHRLAVIGLLYELGECNTFLDYFWGDFPEMKGSAAYTAETQNYDEALDFNAKLSAALAQGYYHWFGSLTTPPCTEGVSWNLLKVRQTVCQRQVDALKAALGATQHGIEFNNRVTMPLNHRVVTESGGLALAPLAPVADDATWKYADDTLVPVPTAADAAKQAATWPGLCATGREQSPVNVDTTAVADSCPAGATGDHAITTHISAALEYVKNTGHGLQLFETNPATHDLVAGEVTEMADGQPKGYSMINGAKYNFYQVHWHSPSENTVDGVEYPLEAHFVHQLDDSTNGGLHRLAVIGLLYEYSDDPDELVSSNDCNEFLDYFWGDFPNAKGAADYTGGQALDFNAKLAASLAEGYYHWFGSLTTPPCTEGVSWNLLTARQTVCRRQVNVLKAALGTTQNGLEFNNRVPQPLNHRVVSYRHCSSSDAKSEVHVMAEGQPKGYSMINGAKYNFYQVHWHAPSENTVDGES